MHGGPGYQESKCGPIHKWIDSHTLASKQIKMLKDRNTDFGAGETNGSEHIQFIQKKE